MTLPANTRVLVTACSLATQPYGLIRVPATASLVFDDANITLRAAGIISQGNVSIGSPTCRIAGPVSVIFHGQRTNATIEADPTVTATKVSISNPQRKRKKREKKTHVLGLKC